MRFAIDVAFCDASGLVLRTVTLRAVAGVAGRAPGRVRDRGGGGRVRTLAARVGRPGRAPHVSEREATVERDVLGARRDADRQPRRPLTARGRGAARRRRDRGRGHPPHARPAHPRRRARGGPAARGARAQRAGERATGSSTRCATASASRTSPTRACPASPIPGERLVRACLDAGPRGGRRARAERGAHRAGALGLPDRPVRVRGLPAAPRRASGANGSPTLAGEARTAVLFEVAAPRARDAHRSARPRAARCARSPSPASSPSCTRRCGGARSTEAVGNVGAQRAARRARDRARPRAGAAGGRATTRSTPTCTAALPRACRPATPRARVARATCACPRRRAYDAATRLRQAMKSRRK